LVTDAKSHPNYGQGTGINFDYALMLLEKDYIIDSYVKSHCQPGNNNVGKKGKREKKKEKN
ncbi:MAG: hypothetical protein ACI8RD_011625, partial [Bacillariaceae sp.]